jgi:transcriptional regulator with XRE-family HTH domain
MSKDEFRLLLRRELRKRKNANPQYSMRAFARFLGVNPTFLSQVLRGTRSVSQIMLLKMATRLKLEEGRIEKFKQILIKAKVRKRGSENGAKTL